MEKNVYCYIIQNKQQIKKNLEVREWWIKSQHLVLLYYFLLIFQLLLWVSITFISLNKAFRNPF